MIRNGRGTSQALGPMGAAVAASVSAAASLAKKLTFEVLNLVTQGLPLPPAARGAALCFVAFLCILRFLCLFLLFLCALLKCPLGPVLHCSWS
jgi:hypothetical protein